MNSIEQLNKQVEQLENEKCKIDEKLKQINKELDVFMKPLLHEQIKIINDKLKSIGDSVIILVEENGEIEFYNPNFEYNVWDFFLSDNCRLINKCHLCFQGEAEFRQIGIRNPDEVTDNRLKIKKNMYNTYYISNLRYIKKVKSYY